MANSHALKTLPIYFDAALRGDKTFEVRKNDRDFQTGDTLILKEWDPTRVEPYDYFKPPTAQPPAPVSPGAFTGREITATASYILHDTWGQFGLERGHVVIGLSEVSEGRPNDPPGHHS